MQGPLKAFELLNAGNTLSPLRETRVTHSDPTPTSRVGDGRHTKFCRTESQSCIYLYEEQVPPTCSLYKRPVVMHVSG